MFECCEINDYQPMSNPYNSSLYPRDGWMPPNPFNMSLYVLEHYRPNPNAYCCPNSQQYQGGCCRYAQ